MTGVALAGADQAGERCRVPLPTRYADCHDVSQRARQHFSRRPTVCRHSASTTHRPNRAAQRRTANQTVAHLPLRNPRSWPRAGSTIDPRSASRSEFQTGEQTARAGRPLYFVPRQRKARSVRLRPRRGDATSVPTIGKSVTAGKALAARRAKWFNWERVESCDESPINPSRPELSAAPPKSPIAEGQLASLTSAWNVAGRQWRRLCPSGQRLFVSRS